MTPGEPAIRSSPRPQIGPVFGSHPCSTGGGLRGSEVPSSGRLSVDPRPTSTSCVSRPAELRGRGGNGGHDRPHPRGRRSPHGPTGRSGCPSRRTRRARRYGASTGGGRGSPSSSLLPSSWLPSSPSTGLRVRLRTSEACCCKISGAATAGRIPRNRRVRGLRGHRRRGRALRRPARSGGCRHRPASRCARRGLPDDDAIVVFVFDASNCELTRYAGTTSTPRGLDVTVVWPADDAWTTGERDLICSAFRLDLQRLDGTVRDGGA